MLAKSSHGSSELMIHLIVRDFKPGVTVDRNKYYQEIDSLAVAKDAKQSAPDNDRKRVKIIKNTGATM